MNESETIARVRKADDFATVLRDAGCTSDALFDLSEVGWHLATQLVSVKRGLPVGVPSDATKALIHHALLQHENERPSGPHLLEGLPS